MKDGTSAPEHVDRQIRELDKLVKRIRHKRYTAQKAVRVLVHCSLDWFFSQCFFFFVLFR